MKNLLFVLLVVSVVTILVPNLLTAEEIPFGVTPKEIVVTGTVEPEPDQMQSLGYLHASDKLTDDYVYAEGNRIGVSLESIDYSIHFWNVGKLGGTSGYLFWKKDFGKAVMYLDYNVNGNGQIVGEGKEWKEMPGQPFWPIEPATNEPTVRQSSCIMQFSGGPRGTFEGVCNNGATISGRVGAGSFIVFDKISEPSDKAEVELAHRVILQKDLKLNGEFSDWKFDDTGLVDSGTRFNSISGQVETRHEQETNGWKLANLDDVLYVDDHIKTFEESSAILSFADMSTFLMKEESEIALNAPPGKDSKVKMVYGKVMANIKKMMLDGSMEIDMSQAVAGIKGTRFELTETGTESTIAVTEGTVAFTSKSTGEMTMVTGGEAVTATESGLSEKTTFDAAVADELLLRETDVTNQPVLVVSDIEESNYTLHFAISIGLLSLVGGSLYYWVRRKKKLMETAEVTVPE